jgi:ArsR family transcriptional regulator
VIVTMGLSVGVVDIANGVRHEDWRVGDPTGATIDEVRRVRDDIAKRVRALLTDLGGSAGQDDEPAGEAAPAHTSTP